MSDYFFAVGGTGQQVASAYNRLALLCGIRPAKLVIIDSDTSENEENITYSLSQVEKETFEPALNEAKCTFNDLFHDANDDVRKILNLLFVDDELGTEVCSGMFGNPSVGAVTFMNTIVNLNDEGSSLKEYIDTITSDCNVVVCGSLAGGTGAGVMPILAKHIKEITDARVKIVGFLKWFEVGANIKAGDVYDAARHADRTVNDILRVNTESGFRYLQDNISKEIDSCVLLGLKDLFNIVQSADNGVQGEKRHPITLIAATIANNFFNGRRLNEGLYSYLKPSGYGLHPSDIDVILPDKKRTKTTTEKVFMMNKAMVRLLELIEKYLEDINDGIPKLTFAPWLAYPNHLAMIIRTKYLAGVEAKDVIEKIITKIQDERVKFNESMTWFNELCEKTSGSQDSRISDMFVFIKDGISINEKTIEKIEGCSMPFILKIFKKMNHSLPEQLEDIEDDLVKKIIKQLRIMINKKFLNSSFGSMKYI